MSRTDEYVKKVFVTVGTTEFNELIEAVTSEEILSCLVDKGYTHLVLQIGKGCLIPESKSFKSLIVEVFRYKPSILEDFVSSSLVISHAGAGSCFEALEAGKPLIAVVNESLMDNHQSELAQALTNEGFCTWCKTNSLLYTLQELKESRFKPYESGNSKRFSDYLDSVFITKS